MYSMSKAINYYYYIIFRKVTHDNLDLGALIRSVLYCDKHVNSVATLIAFDA